AATPAAGAERLRGPQHRRRVPGGAGVAGSTRLARRAARVSSAQAAPSGALVKTLVVVQARMGSTRLPGKVLLPLAGAPLLQRMLERIEAARTPFELTVATTTAAADDPIRQLCRRLGVRCYSGHPTDLLDRHYQAARELRADAVVKIPSDC